MKDVRDADLELEEWCESLDEVIQRAGIQRAGELLAKVADRARRQSVKLPFTANTPCINTIPAADEPAYPGDLEIERRLGNAIGWNAMAMVVRANREEQGIGGHLSTYASTATLFEVAFNHFLRAPREAFPGDLAYFQGHASPGVYARAFLEGRISAERMRNFRHETRDTPGLSSYPHPWLMPEFWQFPTVSMGLGPITAIYQARFIKYLEDRGLTPRSDRKVWAFLGDGETDEPESLGAITLASRENLDNLIFVVNCNLQRLDGPVRGNGKIIQELEAVFRGAGWNVIKVVWGRGWDPLLESDHSGLLVQRMTEVVDGQFQKYAVAGGAFFRKDFFGKHPQLLQLVEHLSDADLEQLERGGHDLQKVHAAYRQAAENTGKPTVILCKTIKGHGLGQEAEGLNISHQQKKLTDATLLEIRSRLELPLSDDEARVPQLYLPPPDTPELTYLHARRKELGGYLPARPPLNPKLALPPDACFAEFSKGTGTRAVSTTMAFVKLLANLLKDETLGPRIVPMIPDEARTFGMEALFRQCGIYSHLGQLYEPVDRENLLYYREATDGQILEEGITEAGCLSSFIAAGTAQATHGLTMIPFFTFYSMFGMQRVGDLIWAAGDSRARGFLMGATSGRTTLPGEGLQHQDGNSHLTAMTVPNLLAYDPAYAYELAVIIRAGLQRMYGDGEDVFYYITLTNENLPQPPLPEGVEAGIVRGLYPLRAEANPDVQLLGSGPLLAETIAAAELLGRHFGVRASLWSVTSYQQLHRNAWETERRNRQQPQSEPQVPYVAECLNAAPDAPVVAVTDYVRAVAETIGRWVAGPYVTLGTDGFGRSDGRAALRRFFEVDAASIAYAALCALARLGRFPAADLNAAAAKLEIDLQQRNPLEC